MSNENLNRLSYVMTDSEIQLAVDLLKKLQDVLKFTQGVTTDTRLLGINVENKVFVENVINVVKQMPDIYPKYMDIEKVDEDLTLFKQLDSIELYMSNILGQIRVTKAIAGDEAYKSALTAYRLTEEAMKAGIPGADAMYNSLSKRFKGQGVSSGKGKKKERAVFE